MKQIPYLRLVLFALLCSTLLLSGQTCDEGTAGQCVPGRVVSCPCSDGSDGFQECLDDNTYGACVCSDASASQPDVVDNDAGEDAVEDDAMTDDAGDAQDDASGSNLPYRYVRITDLSSANGGETPGADIDAIKLGKSDGSTHWAATVENVYLFNRDPGGPASYAEDVLGSADSVSSDGLTCDPNSGYLSLGGAIGYVTIQFGEGVEIEAGDTVSVYEVGNCDTGTNPATAEPIRIEVGTDPGPGNVWGLVANANGSPIMTYVVEESHLPPVSGD